MNWLKQGPGNPGNECNGNFETRGNSNPEAANFNSLTDYCFAEHAVELQLPWELLNFSNPSRNPDYDDYYEKYHIRKI